MDQLLRISVEGAIRSAFQDVTLGRGISLTQAQLIDERDAGPGANCTPTDHEITDDRSGVPFEELERACVAHLDAPGFRLHT